MIEDLPAPSSNAPRRLAFQRAGHAVPVAIWMPPADCSGIVMACHGGSGHKESAAIRAIAARFTAEGCAVVAIDGPVHGERRSDGDLDPAAARQAFREAWRAGLGRTDVAADFSATLDTVLADAALRGRPVAYIGVSMGTAYGLPLLAFDPRFCAAAIGLWSTTYPASDHLAGFARDVECAVWFTQQWDDEYFDRDGVQALFDAIGSADKRLVAYPGPHMELQGHRLDDAVAFLLQRLRAARTASEVR